MNTLKSNVKTKQTRVIFIKTKTERQSAGIGKSVSDI